MLFGKKAKGEKPVRRYFKYEDELILHGLILLAVLGLSLEVFLQIDITPVEERYWRMFRNVVLLNSSHLVLPFVFLLFYEPGRQFLSSKARQRSYLNFIGLSIALLLTVSFFTNFTWILPAHLDLYRDFLTRIFWLTVPFVHSVRQSWGISILMTRSSLQTPQVRSFSRQELTMMNLYSVGFAILFLCNGFPQMRAYQHWPAALCVGLAGFAMWSASKISSFHHTTKLLFMSRLLLWPLLPFS